MSEAGPVEAKSDKSATGHQKVQVAAAPMFEGGFEPALESVGRTAMSDMSEVLPHIDGAQRGRQVNRLQRTHGNAFVSRLLSPALKGTPAARRTIARVANGRTPTSSPVLPDPMPAYEEPPQPAADSESMTVGATGAVQPEPAAAIEAPAESLAGSLGASGGHFEGDGHDHAHGDEVTLDAAGATQREPSSATSVDDLDNKLDVAATQADTDSAVDAAESAKGEGEAKRAGLPPTHEQRLAMDRTARPPQFPYRADAETLNAGQVKWGKHQEFPRVLGQTMYAHNGIELWPSFNAKVSRRIMPWGFQAKPNVTDAAGGVWTALATPANEQGYKMPDEHPKHPGHEFFIRESGAAANVIAGAEQQHLNDLDTGWAITGLAARDAINAVAAEEPEVKDDAVSAKKAAVDKTAAKMGPLGAKIRGNLESGGRLESGLGPIMDKSFLQSKAQRDDTGKHTLGIRYVTKDSEKKQVLYEIIDDKPLDPTPTDSVINLGTIG